MLSDYTKLDLTFVERATMRTYMSPQERSQRQDSLTELSYNVSESNWGL